MAARPTFGDTKFPRADLLDGSGGRWRGVTAEVRRHPAGELVPVEPSQMEVTLALVAPPTARVERRAGGLLQSTEVRPGTLWFCPIGVKEEEIRIRAPLDQVLHLHIAEEQFTRVSMLSSRAILPSAIAYLAAVEDELVRQIGYQVLRELRRESSAGALLVEQLSLTLLLHLIASYSTDGLPAQRSEGDRGALDARRLRRVLDFIEDCLDQDLTLAALADVACLSRHHFARAFAQATGSPPHRYVAEKRLALARHLLSTTETPIADIAATCRFASQAAFTKAFRQRTGASPGAYRRVTRGLAVR